MLPIAMVVGSRSFYFFDLRREESPDSIGQGFLFHRRMLQTIFCRKESAAENIPPLA